MPPLEADRGDAECEEKVTIPRPGCTDTAIGAAMPLVSRLFLAESAEEVPSKSEEEEEMEGVLEEDPISDGELALNGVPFAEKLVVCAVGGNDLSFDAIVVEV